MKFYSEFIFPKIFDILMRRNSFVIQRASLLKAAHGKCLEVGIGTGLNLKFYPSHINEIVAVDPNPGMQVQLMAQHSNHRIKIDFSLASAESLPYENETFDTVVSTLTFCSISNLPAALSEIKRVMKKSGQLIFLEHGLSHEAHIAKWQKRLDPVQNIEACGCSLTVNTTEQLKVAGFKIKSINNYYNEKSPKLMGYMYEGIAVLI
ncbi:MAG: class I SAM-dependent methyltransferase [Pseudobdellovibrio sp.]